MKLRQIIKARCIRLSGFFLHAVQHQPFSPDLFGNPTDPLRIKGSRTAGLSILPGKADPVRINFQSIIRLRPERTNLILPVCDQRKGRCLHPPAGQLCVIFACQRPGRIDSYKPVRLCAGPGSIIEILIVSSVTETSKSFPDGPVRHGGNPEPLHRFLISCLFKNPSCHQLSFPSCVRGNNDLSDILSVYLALYRIILLCCLADHGKLPCLRHHRKHIHLPLFPFRLIFFRISKCHKMAKPPGDNIPFSLDGSLSVFLTFQHPGNVSCHRWLFCDY